MTMSLAYESKTLVDCANSKAYDNQLITKIKGKWERFILKPARTERVPARKTLSGGRSGGGVPLTRDQNEHLAILLT